MGLKIDEFFCEGKLRMPELCEDITVCNEDFVAVIDGATNVSGKLIAGKTPGRFAAELISSVIESLPEISTLADMLERIKEKMQAAYREHSLHEAIEENAYMAPTASLIIYSRHFNEIWQIGDCQCIVEGRLYTNEKAIDNITANARSLFLEAEIKKGKTIEQLLHHDTSWDYIQELIQRQYYLQNDAENQYGFEIINGFKVNERTIQIIKVPEEGGSIVLASDGYPVLKGTLAESEECLSSIMEHDPLCFRIYKSAKGLKPGNTSFDDRTYVKFIVNNE